MRLGDRTCSSGILPARRSGREALGRKETPMAAKKKTKKKVSKKRASKKKSKKACSLCRKSGHNARTCGRYK